MTLKELIWKNEHLWPIDNFGYIFLARGVHRIGKAMFSDDWNEFTPLAELARSLPPYSTADIGDKERAIAILKGIYADYTPNPIYEKYFPSLEALGGFVSEKKQLPTLNDLLNNQKPLDYDINLSDWEDAKGYVYAQQLAHEPDYRRWDAVRRRFAEEALNERILLKTRFRKGGAFEPFPAEWWNTESYWYESRFDCCTLDRIRPFDEGNSHWIFVRESDVDALIKRILANISDDASVKFGLIEESKKNSSEQSGIEAVSKAFGEDEFATADQIFQRIKVAGIITSRNNFDKNLFHQGRKKAGYTSKIKRGPKPRASAARIS